MNATRSFFTFYLILHTFWGNANASIAEDFLEAISLKVTHKQCSGMRGLGHIMFSIFDGKKLIQHLPMMDVHSPVTSPREDTALPPTQPSYRRLAPHKNTTPIALIHFKKNNALRVSFLSDTVHVKTKTNDITGQKENYVQNHSWHGLVNIDVMCLDPDLLESHNGGPLVALEIDIVWENLDSETPTITAQPFYNKKTPVHTGA